MFAYSSSPMIVLSWRLICSKISSAMAPSCLTLFWAGSGITLLGGGAIMARMDSSHPEAVCRHPKAQKWLPSNFFDLWLSIDTKNSTLWAVVLANPAVKRPWRKMKIFMQKYVKMKFFFDTWELYTSKESLEHVQYKFKKKKYAFLPKKNFFLIFSIFFQRGTLWCRNRQKIFSVFQKF